MNYSKYLSSSFFLLGFSQIPPLLGMTLSVFLYWHCLGLYSQEFDSTVVSLKDDSRTQLVVLHAILLSLGEM